MCLCHEAMQTSEFCLPNLNISPKAACMPCRQRVSCAAVEERTQQERTSLIPETLRELAEDREQQALVQRLQQEGQASLSREERRKRQRSLDSIGAPPFQSVLKVSPTIQQPPVLVCSFCWCIAHQAI